MSGQYPPFRPRPRIPEDPRDLRHLLSGRQGGGDREFPLRGSPRLRSPRGRALFLAGHSSPEASSSPVHPSRSPGGSSVSVSCPLPQGCSPMSSSLRHRVISSSPPVRSSSSSKSAVSVTIFYPFPQVGFPAVSSDCVPTSPRTRRRTVSSPPTGLR